MSYTVVDAADHQWEERPASGGSGTRFKSVITTAADLVESRAQIWRLPAHSRGPRHIEQTQEEVFLVLEGTLTMLLGDPPERFDLTPRSVVAVKPGTAIQMRNESDEEVAVFAYGAPPIVGVDYLDDIEQL